MSSNDVQQRTSICSSVKNATRIDASAASSSQSNTRVRDMLTPLSAVAERVLPPEGLAQPARPQRSSVGRRRAYPLWGPCPVARRLQIRLLVVAHVRPPVIRP